MLKIDAAEKKALKGRGYILTNDGEHFIARIVSGNGVYTNEEMAAIVKAAKDYGSGDLALTSRMNIEVQGIPYENIEPFGRAIAEAGLLVGGTGAKVRPVVCCKGTVCVHGLADTQGLADAIHQKFFLGWNQVALPHKFKIGVGGCPNNCIKPQLNDFGVIGHRKPIYDVDKCKACGKCPVIAGCPMKICAKDENGKMAVDTSKCTGCGKCIDNCLFGAVQEEAKGLTVTVGGIWGKHQRMGTAVPGVYTTEELLVLLEKCILLYRDLAYAGERLGRCMERIGVEAFMAQLLSDDVLNRKEEILAAPLKTRE